MCSWPSMDMISLSERKDCVEPASAPASALPRQILWYLTRSWMWAGTFPSMVQSKVKTEQEVRFTMSSSKSHWLFPPMEYTTQGLAAECGIFSRPQMSLPPSPSLPMRVRLGQASATGMIRSKRRWPSGSRTGPPSFFISLAAL